MSTLWKYTCDKCRKTSLVTIDDPETFHPCTECGGQVHSWIAATGIDHLSEILMDPDMYHLACALRGPDLYVDHYELGIKIKFLTTSRIRHFLRITPKVGASINPTKFPWMYKSSGVGAGVAYEMGILTYNRLLTIVGEHFLQHIAMAMDSLERMKIDIYEK